MMPPAILCRNCSRVRSRAPPVREGRPDTICGRQAIERVRRQTTTVMATIAQPSVMSLFIEMYFDGQLLATGTGFLVRRADRVYLITNRHNIRGRRNDNDHPLHAMGALPNSVVVHHNAAG